MSAVSVCGHKRQRSPLVHQNSVPWHRPQKHSRRTQREHTSKLHSGMPHWIQIPHHSIHGTMAGKPMISTSRCLQLLWHKVFVWHQITCSSSFAVVVPQNHHAKGRPVGAQVAKSHVRYFVPARLGLHVLTNSLLASQLMKMKRKVVYRTGFEDVLFIIKV